jgi:hypothetical protein
MGKNSSKKKQRIKDIRNLRRKVKKNLKRKAKKNVYRKGEEKNMTGNTYEKALEMLRELVKNRKVDGFTFIYEPGKYGEGRPSVLSSAREDKSLIEMMMIHICSITTAVVDIIASQGHDRQKILADIIDMIREGAQGEFRMVI